MMKKAAFTIIITFLSAIVLGALLLMLPYSTVSGSLNIEDAFFTSTSAVTVTGLITVDTATYFTLFGKTVLLVLIQFGGLGFMTFSTLIILLIGKSITLTGKIIIENDFTAGKYKSIKKLVKKIFLITFLFEFIGMVLFFFNLPDLPLKERLISSVFHSISAFCNAGFSLFSNSFENYATNTGINFILMFLIIFGGIGFLVLDELYLNIKTRKKLSKISLHSKLVITTSFILIATGFIFIFIEEIISNQGTSSIGSKAMYSLFQSVTARTAGFNTIKINLLSHASIVLTVMLMFIGASPGSTGGGIKTSTLGIIFAYFRSSIKGKKNMFLFYRNIPAHLLKKAFLVLIISILIIFSAFILLVTFEKKLGMRDLLFETVSAFGTVGLSSGITAQLSVMSKITVMLTMLIGRIGPLTLLIALSRRESKAIYDYPEENIMIG